jgi:glycosyltransferase involved in cell wall biosynthesis
MPVPVIVSERNDPHAHNAGLKANLLRSVLYRRANAITVQTKAAASYFTSSLGKKTIVIPNAVVVPPPVEPVAKQGNSLVAMGRLSHEKGFDLLLQAFATLAERFPDWTLTIWGEGDLRAALEAQRDALGLRDRVSLPGRTKSPDRELQRADLFVLSSRYEGFPNVLAEAMANGLPVVSFDCPSGPSDLIEAGVNGILAPPGDVDALASALAKLMGDGNERARLGTNAKRVTKTFSLDSVMAMWESVIDNRQHVLQELR